MSKEDEIEETRKRFKPIAGNNELFEYKVDGVKENFKIKVISSGNPNATIRVTPVIYKNEDRTIPVLDLPLSEISPQFDLKNTLVNELIETLIEFRESLFNTPIGKPGIQHFIMLKLSLLLDMPGICWLFLKGGVERRKGWLYKIYNSVLNLGEKLLRLFGITNRHREDYNEYKLSNNPKINAIMMLIFSHNIGGFLRDEKVRAIVRDMGKEEELDEWYDKLAKAKAKFLKDNINNLNPKSVEEERQKLKAWFGERYSIGGNWHSLGISWCFAFGIIILVLILMAMGPFRIILGIPRFVNSIFIIFIIGLCFISAFEALYSKNTKFMKSLIKTLFEMHSPRLFMGTFIGAFSLYGFEEALWKMALTRDSLWYFSLVIFFLSSLYFWTKFEREKIGQGFCYRLWHVSKILLWTLYLSILSVGINVSMLGDFFVKKVDQGQYDICHQLLIFWIFFSIFAGIFIQLFWQKEKITEPI
ncbi:MAG: hypothetical protein Q8P40_05710 [Nitrospirota bacterium]|nr:hypothetical protein [Nitrospirota bacterium]